MYYRDENNQWQEIILPPSGDTLPIGAITEFAGVTPPSGWLICDGRAISRTTYSELFGVIGTTYGSGDESTTFNIPDYTGKIGVGLKSNDSNFNVLGATGGEKTHTLTIAEMPSHTHSVKYDQQNSTGTEWLKTGGSSGGPYYSTTYVTNTGGGNAHNNLQPYITINYIIKAKQKVAIAGSVTNDINSTDLDACPNASTIKNYVDSKQTYSETEAIVGKWINNKPVYRRVLKYTPSNFTNNHEMSTGITNLEDIVKMDAVVHNNSDTGWRNIPWTYSNSNFPTSWSGGFFLKTNGGIFFQLGSSLADFSYIYVIVEYTKTTD